MKRIMIKISYDGTNYSGWQSGGIGICIEDTINKCLKELTGEARKIIGTSRTDSGVHARGNIAVFDTESTIDPNVYNMALNNLLPLDIRILESKEVDGTFHPRKVNSIKTYTYKVLNQKISDPLKRLYSYFVYHNIDIEKMKEAASILIGEHDFMAFINPRSNIIQAGKLKELEEMEEKENENESAVFEDEQYIYADNMKHTTIRTIFDIDIKKDEDNIITFTFKGNGFLYHQIRIMVGSLLRVGMNMWDVKKIIEILASKDRKNAGPTAPACGLCLEEIVFE